MPSGIAVPPESSMTQPRQKKSKPIVATMAGTPVRVIIKPFTNPIASPVATPAAAPASTEPVVFDTSAKTKPDIAMFEAKDKSISPVTTTSVIAVATIMMNGIVERKVM